MRGQGCGEAVRSVDKKESELNSGSLIFLICFSFKIGVTNV